MCSIILFAALDCWVIMFFFAHLNTDVHRKERDI